MNQRTASGPFAILDESFQTSRQNAKIACCLRRLWQAAKDKALAQLFISSHNLIVLIINKGVALQCVRSLVY